MESGIAEANKLSHDLPIGRGRNKHFWSEDESWLLIRCLQDLAADPQWKTDGGFKNNYMNEIRKIMVEKMPNLTKEWKHIDSRIKFLKTKFHAISEMTRQSGCTWDGVANMIKCERPWYDDWVKNHKDAKGLYNVSFPYLSELEIVYGKDRATGLGAEDPITAAKGTINAELTYSVTDDSPPNEDEVEVDSMSSSKKKRKHPSSSSKETSNQAGPKSNKNNEPNFKVLSDRIEGFMHNVSSHFESMSDWVQGKSSKMPQVLEELSKYGFKGKDKFKAAQAICEEAVKVELLFKLDPSEVTDYVCSFLD